MEEKNEESKDWIVRLERRRDGKMYFFGRDGNCNARRSSSMRMTKEVAKQFAHSIAVGHKDFTARAMRFDSPVHTAVKDISETKTETSKGETK